MTEVTRTGRFMATIICALILVSSGVVHGERQAINGIWRIQDIFDYNRRSAPRNVQNGEEASIACMEVVFLEWHHLYSTALSSLPAELNARIGADFSEAEKNARDTLEEVFDANRPHLSDAIRQTLSDFRAQRKAPGVPVRVAIEDFQENTFVDNLQFCKNQNFLMAVAQLIPPTSANRSVARTVKRQVPDYENISHSDGGTISGSGSVGAIGAIGAYIPMREEVVKVFKIYADWINIIARGH